MQDGYVQLPQRSRLNLRVLVQELEQAKRRVLGCSVGMLQRSPVGALDHGTRIR
ncbi:hypothetical protein [Streptomyces pristinaespiralis]|uniref:hypothetical protein n=1 Tax=Streptomyces pristinaespiralis TaxID=38300 RepID=UPI0038374564